MPRLSPDQRKKLGDLAVAGKSYASLERQFKVKYCTIKHWEHVARTTRVWTDQARPGRPKKVNTAQRKQIRSLAKSNYSTKDVAQRVSRSAGHQISRTTVGRVLKYSKKPLLYVPVNRGRPLSDVNKVGRYDWSLEHLHAQFGTWLYGDSKFIYIYAAGPNSTSFKWVDPTVEPVPKSGQLLYVLHFYGLVGKNFKSKLIFTAPTPPGRTNSRKYSENFCSKHFCKVATQLDKEIKKSSSVSPRYKVVLDSASQHTSAKSQAHLAQLGMPLVADFPSQSWDLNIIEYVWGVLDTKLCKRHGKKVTSAYGWQRRIKSAWDEVDQSTINKLVAGMRGRVAAVAEGKGAWLRKKKN